MIDEAEDLVRCQNGDTMPVTVLGCGRFVGTGVRVTRRIRQTRGGTLVHVVDVFRSVDGQQHALDLHWLNVFRDPPGDPEPSFQLPWVSGDYEIPASGRQRPAPPGAPFTIFARANHHAGDGERPWPQGAIVFDTPASGPIEFFSPTEFIVPMNVTVPAGGEATVRQSFVTALTRAEAAEVAAAAEDGFVAPTVAITAPAEGASFSQSPIVDVTGTAADGARRPAVTLNGTEVAVGADGAWSGRVTLAPGDNTADRRGPRRRGRRGDRDPPRDLHPDRPTRQRPHEARPLEGVALGEAVPGGAAARRCASASARPRPSG